MTEQKETWEQARRRSRAALQERGEDIAIAGGRKLPWTLAELAQVDGSEPYVLRKVDSGLTAFVYHLKDGDTSYALKQARVSCLVQNVDGQTSFLNELLCRSHIEELRARQPGSFAAVTRTHAASLKQGVLITEWIDGVPIAEWDRRRLEQVFASGSELLLAGLFEWDFCPGNLLDDGQVRLFDFGYTYPFDPLRHYNSAGNGDNVPMFHLAERFETRNYFSYLLGIEREKGMQTALDAFRLEKEVAVEAYVSLQQTLRERGASANVIGWLQGLIDQWTAALEGELRPLYLKEGWRSHVLDLEDDLHGQTCTPMTLARSGWILDALTEHHDALTALDAFFWQDAGLSRQQLLQAYRERQVQAEKYQISRVA